ncbi:hypothetical protein DNTS_014504 [Danionella cerebrum]|uniref:Ubiquitin-like domain-containing protein n=1 Tax=Danionella cerebrum TaxID=2873325 RepID=A0A553R3M9_9TELE|nr:hypothetical protein DNTS_014504 [Danionella translucida]
MLRWSAKERGRDLRQLNKESQDVVKDTEEESKEPSSEVSKESPRSSCFGFEELRRILNLKLVHVLNMTSAEIMTYSVQPHEDVASLQQRIEQDTQIPPANQELLLEAGLALEPHHSVMQCAIDYSVDKRRADEPLVFLFDRSCNIYEVQFTPRALPENVRFIQNEPKQLLPYSSQRRTWGQAWHTIRAMKEDWQRLQQGQKVAIMSLLRHNGTLSKQKNEMVSMYQRLKATLEFFNTSLHIDIDKYQEQRATGIEDVNKLEEEMMTLQTDIVDLQRQPWRSGEALETLEIKAMELFRKLREKTREQRNMGDCQEVIKLVFQAGQFYERKLKDFYTHLSKTMLCRQRVLALLPRVEGTVSAMARNERTLLHLQEKRQKELWNLLRVACSKVRSPVSGSPDGRTPPASGHPLTPQKGSLNSLQTEDSQLVIEESKLFESRMQSLVQDTIQETESSMQFLRELKWLNGGHDLA